MRVRRGRIKTGLFSALTVMLIIALLYGGSVLFRGYGAYTFLKQGDRGWPEGLYASDKALGSRVQPDIIGYELLFGTQIPVRTDANALRIPLSGQSRLPDRPRILFLGDSFTFGAAEPAENTFAELTGKALHANVLNAGVPSYGLAHMRLYGEEMINRLRPDVVIIQYSPWLIERALSPFAASYVGAVPSPFYTASTLGPELHGLQFWNLLPDLPAMHYVNSDAGVADFIQFMAQVGWPLITDGDYQTIKIAVGPGPAALPSADPLRVVEKVYRELDSIARGQGATPIILALGSDKEFSLPQPFFPEQVPVIDAHHYLLDQLVAAKQESYGNAYWHWQGDPPQMVDSHPNAVAHEKISEILVAAIRVVRPDLVLDESEH